MCFLLCAVLLSLLFETAALAAACQPDLMVKIAADGDGSYVGGGVIEATASAQTTSQAAFQGTPALFRVLLRNAGDASDSFVVRGTGSGNGVTVRYLDDAGTDRTAALAGTGYLTGTLAPGASQSFQVQVTPDAITPGASYRVVVTAASSADASKSDQVKMETVACGSSAAVTVSAPPDGSGTVGGTVSYPYAVTNVGSAVNSFALSATASDGWQATLRADDGTTTAMTGPLAPGASYRFSLAVTVPATGTNGDRATTHLTVNGDGASAADDVTTTALAATVSVAESVRNITQGGSFQPTAAAFPGDTLEYRLSVTNSGSVPAGAVAIDSPLPANTAAVPGSFWIGTSSGGDGAPCAAAACGLVRESAGSVVARLGQGATDAAGGSILPGNTLYVYFRVQVD